jgi:hypothetical protein
MKLVAVFCNDKHSPVSVHVHLHLILGDNVRGPFSPSQRDNVDSRDGESFATGLAVQNATYCVLSGRKYHQLPIAAVTRDSMSTPQDTATAATIRPKCVTTAILLDKPTRVPKVQVICFSKLAANKLHILAFSC